MAQQLQLSDRTRRIIAVAAGVPAAGFLGYTAVSHLYYRRSNTATASEIYNRVTAGKDKMADAVEWDNYILHRAEVNEQRYSLPVLATFKVPVEDLDMEGMQALVLNRRNLNDRCVVYLHGTSLIDRPSIYHWRFLDEIARRTRAEVIVPLYPQAPVHTFEEAYDAVERIYRHALEKYGAEAVTLMGDCSGGGLAAGFCQTLPGLGLPQPQHLVLISPWLDATLRNPDVVGMEVVDPMFATYGLRKVAHTWAHGTDLDDPRLSPINGPVRCLRNVSVFTGTREVFHPDAVLFQMRARAAGVHAELFEGTGLNANYPLYPIPEAKRGIQQVVEAVDAD